MDLFYYDVELIHDLANTYYDNDTPTRKQRFWQNFGVYWRVLHLTEDQKVILQDYRFIFKFNETQLAAMLKVHEEFWEEMASDPPNARE